MASEKGPDPGPVASKKGPGPGPVASKRALALALALDDDDTTTILDIPSPPAHRTQEKNTA